MLDKQNAAVAISLYCCYYYCSVCLLVSYTIHMLPQCIQLLRKRHKLESTRVYLVSSSTGLYYFVGQEEGDMLVVDGLDGLLY